MKIAHIDASNKLLGWYDSDIHDTIPTPNVEVTDEQWQIAIDAGHNKVNTDGTTEAFDFRTAEEVFADDVTAWKTSRELAVRNIEVTYGGVVYQGDEDSQTRMARAIVALPDDVTAIDWVAKDNSVNALTKPDLQAILLDAGNQQAALWSVGRPVL